MIAMQQFQVPQFIAIEDRIIGPLTLKQFFYLLGAASIALLGWFFLVTPLFVILAVPPASLFVAMAFIKINERPLPTIFANAINYYLKPRLYLWRQAERKKPPQKVRGEGKPAAPPLVIPKLSESKLSDLAWSLDVKERIGRG